MVTGPVLLDTNVLIYALNETHPEARTVLKQAALHGSAISIVTWAEVMAGAVADDAEQTQRFLVNFVLLGINLRIAKLAAELRKTARLKLPDAFIYATALVTTRTLVTFDIEHFSGDMPSVHISSLTRPM